MQNGVHLSFTEWLPTRLQAGWYGHVAVADFIGSDTGNKLQVKELDDLSAETGNKHLVGYAGYEHGKIAKIALLNLELWNGTMPKQRPSAKVDILVEGLKDGTEVAMHYLTGPNGTATAGLTWDGLDWPYSKKGKERQRNKSEE
ncbi:hypothetical protein BGZ63DRAFT_446364 [Mariannaea sp. PMI_226]|nr:hypothetical protein BGZ63DRAFT_446364 [Mariannaea sp. PMI_226]